MNTSTPVVPCAPHSLVDHDEEMVESMTVERVIHFELPPQINHCGEKCCVETGYPIHTCSYPTEDDKYIAAFGDFRKIEWTLPFHTSQIVRRQTANGCGYVRVCTCTGCYIHSCYYKNAADRLELVEDLKAAFGFEELPKMKPSF